MARKDANVNVFNTNEYGRTEFWGTWSGNVLKKDVRARLETDDKISNVHANISI